MRVRWEWLPALIVALAGCTQPVLQGTPDGPTEPLPQYEAPEALGWSWVLGPDLPIPVSNAACTAFRGALWVVGGIGESNTPSSSVQSYSFSTGSWSRRAALPDVRLYDSAAVSISGRLQIIGGYQFVGQSGISDKVLEFHPSIGLWTDGNPLTRPLAEATVLLPPGEDTPLLIGGTHDGRSATEEILTWSGGSIGSWVRAPIELATARADGAYAFTDDPALVATGGWQDGHGDVLYDSEAQDLGAQRVVPWNDVPTPRSNAARATWGDRVFLLGGNDHNGTVLSAVEFLDLDQKAWFRVMDMPQPVRNACAVPWTDGLHVLGGTDPDGEISDQHWVLRRLIGG